MSHQNVDGECTHLVIAEGSDEIAVLQKMADKLSVGNQTNFHCLKGVNGLSSKLKIIAAENKFLSASTVFIILDAELDLEARKYSVLSALSKFGVTESQAEKSLIEPVLCNGKTYRTFICHGDDGTGSIEDIVDSALESNTLYVCIRDCVSDCLETAGFQLDRKAKPGLFISSQIPKTASIGHGLKALGDVEKTFAPIFNAFEELVS